MLRRPYRRSLTVSSALDVDLSTLLTQLVTHLSHLFSENFTDTEFPLPSYVQSKVDEWMTKTQDLVDTYGEIQPTINLGFNYIF